MVMSSFFALSDLPISTVLAALCLGADKLLPSGALQWPWAKAIVDNATHGAVAAISWLLAARIVPISSLIKWPPVAAAWECVICGAVASFIDVDHFVQAGSWRLEVNYHVTLNVHIQNL